MNIWGKGFVLLGIISSLVFVGTQIYDAGYQSASLHYEKAINEQRVELKKQQQALENTVYGVEKEAVKQIDDVQTIYVPVEKEIIKYVSTSPPSRCDNNFSEWVRIHNAAANPYSDKAASGIDESATTNTGTN